MAKAKTSSFIHEFPLLVSNRQETKLLARMDMARQLYNACLGEALRRLALLRQSKKYQAARRVNREDKKARSKAFKDANQHYGFTEYGLHKFAIRVKNACHIGDHLDVHTVQKTASRAFCAVMMFAVTKRGRPRFKGQGQLLSVESKSNAAGIRFRACKNRSHVLWSGLALPVILDRKDRHGVQAHALSCKIKYVRLICRKYNGKNRFYAQLVLEGLPKQKSKNIVSDAAVCLDLGPSTYALYSPGIADLQQFCKELKPVHKKMRVLQRALDRSRRVNNPDNYNQNGTVKTGARVWKQSGRYKDAKAALSGIFNRQAAYRKTLHGKLANEVLAIGKIIKLEDVSYKSFQKNYGKSTGFRAPGMFVSMLRRKAVSAGGKVIDLPARKLKLSQVCQCGEVVKKALSERWHICDCGVRAQRDLYSAFLGYHVKDGVLDTAMAAAAWPGAESLLEQAVSRLIHQSANEGKNFPQSFGLRRRQSGLPAKEDFAKVDTRDAVAVAPQAPSARAWEKLLVQYDPQNPRF
jgi:hypothetical protein